MFVFMGFWSYRGGFLRYEAGAIVLARAGSLVRVD